MAKYGVSHTELMDSVWYVVKAVNAMKLWYITYPLDHEKQIEIVHNFKEKVPLGLMFVLMQLIAFLFGYTSQW